MFFNEGKKFNVGLSDKPTSSVEKTFPKEKPRNTKHLGVQRTPDNHISDYSTEEIVELPNTTNKSSPTTSFTLIEA